MNAPCLRYKPTYGEATSFPRSEIKPKFWLVEDQYNDELYQVMELYDPNALTGDWLYGIVNVMQENEGWAVALGLGDCNLLIFADKLMVPRDKFSKCKSVDAVLAVARDRFSQTKPD